MNQLYNFEKLKIWQKAKSLGVIIYKTTRVFPDDEKFGLSSQLRRASVSISSNIAEGASRLSKKDQARFIEIAYGSLSEVVNQLEIAEELGYISIEEKKRIRQDTLELSWMLSAYRKALLKK